jgi:hypothetical protein
MSAVRSTCLLVAWWHSIWYENKSSRYFPMTRSSFEVSTPNAALSDADGGVVAVVDRSDATTATPNSPAITANFNLVAFIIFSPYVSCYVAWLR